MRILLSIKPQYAEQIFTGVKRFEFRKVLYRNPDVKTVVVYATKPVGKVIGEFTVSDVHSDSPELLWDRTKEHSGISEGFFHDYFGGREIGFALEIENAKRYKSPLELIQILPSGCAPQSFVYLPAAN